MLPQPPRVALAADDAEIMRAGPGAPRPADINRRDVFQAVARYRQQRPPAGQHRQVGDCRLPILRIVARAANRHHLEVLQFAIGHAQTGDGIAGYFAGDKQQLLNFVVDGEFQHGHDMTRVVDLKVGDDDGRLFVYRLQFLLIRDHLARDQTAIPEHALDILAAQRPAMIFADVQLAIAADDVEDFAQHFRQGPVVANGFGHLRQLAFAGDRRGQLVQARERLRQGALQVMPQAHGIAAGRQIVDAAPVNRPQQNRGRGAAVAHCIVLTADQRPRQHGADVFVARAHFDHLAGDDAAAVEDVRCFAGIVQASHGDCARGRPQGRADGRHQLVDAASDVLVYGRLKYDARLVGLAGEEFFLFAHWPS